MKPGTSDKPKSIKIRVSLTKRRSNLLNYASGVVEHFPGTFKFAYAHPNGGLKLRLCQPNKGRYTFSFNSEVDIDDIVDNLGLIGLNAAGVDDDEL